jgi:glucose-6-phosphate isomerase, archaeal
MLNLINLRTLLNTEDGSIDGVVPVERWVSDMKGYYADQDAYQSLLAQEDTLQYTVSMVEPAHGQGDLHYGIGRLLPGRVGQEYFMTKGHFHAWRAAAEYYIGLRGEGVMLLESEDGAESQLLPLTPNAMIYVPGYTAHRTINTGAVPLIYIGICPAQAGHDYGTIGERNFRHVVVEINGKPMQMEREAYLALLEAD